MEKSWRKIKVEESIVKREKTLKNHKIQLIYYLKLKSNAIGRKLGKKHVISHKIGLEMIQFIVVSRLFIQHFEKSKYGVQAANSQRNLDFKNFSDVKMSLKEEGSKRFKD